MLKRLVVGALKGLVLGALAAAAVVYGMKLVSFDGALLAYACAALLGALTGLLTGKPVWAPEAKVEALLKSAVGILLACAALFGLRKWLAVPIDLSSYDAGSGVVGQLPAATLPLIAAFLGAVFELDNTENSAPPATRKRVPGESQASAAELPGEEEPSYQDEVGSNHGRRAGRR